MIDFRGKHIFISTSIPASKHKGIRRIGKIKLSKIAPFL
jgi:hypothetical protein